MACLQHATGIDVIEHQSDDTLTGIGSECLGKRIRLTKIIAAALLLLGTAGCEDKSSVSGTVTYENQLIADGAIRLFPISGTLGDGASAKITDGTYSMGIENQLSPGDYLVAITAFHETGRWTVAPEVVPTEFGGSGKIEKAKEVVQYIPQKYNRASKLEISLESGTNSFNFELEK